jgi:aspartate kinase
MAEAGVNIEMISTSEIRISVVVDEEPRSTTPFGLRTRPLIWTPSEVEAVVYGGTGR